MNASSLSNGTNASAGEAGEPSMNELWFVGVLLDCVATLAGAGGKQFLRHAAVTRNKWFIPLGLLCTAVIDPMFDVSAYAFAAQSVIAPMAGMVVVWNVVLAPFTLKEVLTPTRKLGALLIIVGTVCSGFFGNHQKHDRSADEYISLLTRNVALIYYLAFGLISVACVYVLTKGSQFWSSFVSAAWGGLIAGNMMTTKASAEICKCVLSHMDNATAAAESGCANNPFYTPWPYVFITTSIVIAGSGLYLLARGLRNFEALFMITVFEGFMVLSGAVSGNVVLDEMDGHPIEAMALYCSSVAVTLVGLYILCSGELRSLSLTMHDGARQRSRPDVTASIEVAAEISLDKPL